MESLKKLFKIGHGPSSSHTMGPAFAASDFLKNNKDAKSYKVELYGSLSMTGKGHLTDYIIKEVIPEILVEFKSEFYESHPNTMIFYAYYAEKVEKEIYFSVGGGNIIKEGEKLENKSVYPHHTFKEIKEYIKKENISLAEYVRRFEGRDIDKYLKEVYYTMMSSIDDGLHKEGYLPGKLKVLRKASLIYSKADEKESQKTKELRLISSYAYAVAETNASGGVIVTAPTCGAAGILPAIIKYTKEKYHFSLKKIFDALAVASIFGNLVKENASISGAVHGCQAEIGTACSMAAAFHASLLNMSINQIEYAAEIAMEHHLGLTCDPVMGYVQIPCIERNAVCAMRAIDASRLAYFLNDSQKISFDMVVETMKNTGKDILGAYKETSSGGLANLNLVNENE